jgi:hypothetical protein
MVTGRIQKPKFEFKLSVFFENLVTERLPTGNQRNPNGFAESIKQRTN